MLLSARRQDGLAERLMKWDKRRMTHESLQFVAEFSSTLSIFLGTALECSSFPQSQFNLHFLFILITLCLSSLCISNTLYLCCFKDYFDVV
jgi:hypothetical protein